MRAPSIQRMLTLHDRTAPHCHRSCRSFRIGSRRMSSAGDSMVDGGEGLSLLRVGAGKHAALPGGLEVRSPAQSSLKEGSTRHLSSQANADRKGSSPGFFCSRNDRAENVMLPGYSGEANHVTGSVLMTSLADVAPLPRASGGEQQRVAIALALTTIPIFSPTSDRHLDSNWRHHHDLLLELARIRKRRSSLCHDARLLAGRSANQTPMACWRCCFYIGR